MNADHTLSPDTYAAAFAARCPDCGGGWGNHSRACESAETLAPVVPIHGAAS